MESNPLLHIQCKSHDMPISRCGCNHYEEAIELYPVELLKLPHKGPNTHNCDYNGPTMVTEPSDE